MTTPVKCAFCSNRVDGHIYAIRDHIYCFACTDKFTECDQCGMTTLIQGQCMNCKYAPKKCRGCKCDSYEGTLYGDKFFCNSCSKYVQVTYYAPKGNEPDVMNLFCTNPNLKVSHFGR